MRILGEFNCPAACEACLCRRTQGAAFSPETVLGEPLTDGDVNGAVKSVREIVGGGCQNFWT